MKMLPKKVIDELLKKTNSTPEQLLKWAKKNCRVGVTWPCKKEEYLDRYSIGFRILDSCPFYIIGTTKYYRKHVPSLWWAGISNDKEAIKEAFTKFKKMYNLK